MKKYGAEFIGTFWLVLGGCGSAVLAAAFPDVGIGLLGVSLAFGLTVLTMAFAIGHISGCQASLVSELVITMMFLVIFLGATDERAPQGFAPIAIGLGLTLIHLISIPVTNTSVNPARSTGVALYVGGWAISQLWLFWIAPIIGAALGGIVYRFVGSNGE